MAAINLYTYIIDKNNKNLRQTKPLKIVASCNNTFSDIKEALMNQLNFPVAKQLLLFNNTMQLEKSTLMQAACHQATDINDGKEMYIYLMDEQEARNKDDTLNEVGNSLIEQRTKSRDPLNKVIYIPKPKQEGFHRQTEDNPNAGGKNWICTQCTFDNDPINVNCIVCEGARTK